MAPKVMQYKAQSIVYFKGDKADFIYVLKSGRVSLNYQDIQSGQDVRDLVQRGEFFGVKSALGKYPHDEMALVLEDSVLIQFSVDDFEAAVSTNPRVILKMMTVFSSQLRRIHLNVKSLLSTEKQQEPEQGLRSIGDYYFSHKKYKEASESYARYLKYYPNGLFASKVLEQKKIAESHFSKEKEHVSTVDPEIKKGLSLKSRGDYKGAFQIFVNCAAKNTIDRAKAEFEAGVCLYQIGQADQSILYFSDILQKYPQFSELPETLYFIGKAYFDKKDFKKAEEFLRKFVSLKDGSFLYRKDALSILGEKE